jgi:hypothetical protein
VPTGGLAPGPWRTGGAVPRLKRVIESLESQRGDAYAKGPGTTVYADNMAFARAIDRDVHGANERVANCMIPAKMTVASGIIPRWERIFGLYSAPGTSDQARRKAIATAFARISQPNNYQQTIDNVIAALGPAFVQIVHQDPPDALVWWGLSSLPPVPPAPNGWVPPPWYSTTARIAIQVQQPAGWTEAEFWAAVGAMVPVLDRRLPSWVTWSIYISEGFVLDSYENLATEVFGS